MRCEIESHHVQLFKEVMLYNVGLELESVWKTIWQMVNETFRKQSIVVLAGIHKVAIYLTNRRFLVLDCNLSCDADSIKTPTPKQSGYVFGKYQTDEFSELKSK